MSVFKISPPYSRGRLLLSWDVSKENRASLQTWLTRWVLCCPDQHWASCLQGRIQGCSLQKPFPLSSLSTAIYQLRKSKRSAQGFEASPRPLAILDLAQFPSTPPAPLCQLPGRLHTLAEWRGEW